VTPARGDLIWINFDPTQGHEQAGRRPALVLSHTRYNARTGLMLACPITSQIKGYPLEIMLPDHLKTKGAVLANQVKTLDWQARGFKRIETVPEELLEEVIDVLETLMR
jgi:mRNA interferase MazF